MSLDPRPFIWSEPPLGDAMSPPPAFYTDPHIFRITRITVTRT